MKAENQNDTIKVLVTMSGEEYCEYSRSVNKLYETAVEKHDENMLKLLEPVVALKGIIGECITK